MARCLAVLLCTACSGSTPSSGAQTGAQPQTGAQTAAQSSEQTDTDPEPVAQTSAQTQTEPQPVAQGGAQTRPGRAPRTPAGWRWRLPAGAPEPLSCTRDDECTVSPYPYSADGCCRTFAAPMTRAFSEWHERWIRERCPGGQSDCSHAAVPGSPALPAPCYFEPRCVEGRCASAC